MSASVWTRETVISGMPRVFYSVTLERSYRDRGGKRHYAKIFDAESLGRVMDVCQQAADYIQEQKKGAK